MSKNNFITSEDCFEFGKHKGETYSYVLLNDPEYISWAIKNNAIKISKELNDLIKPENRIITNGDPEMEIEYAEALKDIDSFISILITQKLLIDSLCLVLNKPYIF